MMNGESGGVTGKGFVKGDPRINRSGRPKHFDQFRALAQKIAHEKVIGPDGNPLTMIGLILRRWSRSKDPALQRAFVEYAFGKVPDKIETNRLDDRTTLILHHAHEFDAVGQNSEVRMLHPRADGDEG